MFTWIRIAKIAPKGWCITLQQPAAKLVFCDSDLIEAGCRHEILLDERVLKDQQPRSPVAGGCGDRIDFAEGRTNSYDDTFGRVQSSGLVPCALPDLLLVRERFENGFDLLQTRSDLRLPALQLVKRLSPTGNNKDGDGAAGDQLDIDLRLNIYFVPETNEPKE